MVLGRWQGDIGGRRVLTVAVKEELDAAGKLEFDWRAAKAAKLERKKQQASQQVVPAEETAIVVEA